MKNYSKTTLGTLSLKAKICGFQHISKSLRKQAHSVNGDSKYCLKAKKNGLGQDARHHLAAYALMRDVKFSKLEHHCQEGNYLNPTKVLNILLEHEPHRVVKTEKGWKTDRWTIDKVRNLLIREVE